MATLDSNKVTGVSVVSNATDAANKTYADSVLSGGLPSTTGNDGKFLSVYPGASYWVLRTAGTTNNIYKIAYGNNTYAFGDATNGQLRTSTDTINWTLRTSGNGANAIRELQFLNNIFILGSTISIINVSTDAISWTLRTSGNGGNQTFSFLYANNTYISGFTNG